MDMFFVFNVLKGSCEVLDNGAEVAHTNDWYYQKAQDAIELILKGGSYNVENPCWTDSTSGLCLLLQDVITIRMGINSILNKWFANNKKETSGNERIM